LRKLDHRKIEESCKLFTKIFSYKKTS